MPHERALSRERSIAIDRECQERFAIPSLILMENAGIRAFDEIQRLLLLRSQEDVDLICGAGNNGGDGFVVARHLTNHGFDPRILLLGANSADIHGKGGDASLNLSILEKMEVPIRTVDPSHVAREPDLGLRPDSMVVDAVFGTGLSREVTGGRKAYFTALAGRREDVVSLDVPSGLDCNTGAVLGACVRAHTTITFVLPKKGFYLLDGPANTGRIVIADISAPRSLLQ